MRIGQNNLVCCSSLRTDIAFSVKGNDVSCWNSDSIRLPMPKLRVGKFFTLRVESIADGWTVVKEKLQSLTVSVTNTLLCVIKRTVERTVKSVCRFAAVQDERACFEELTLLLRALRL